jgi:ABC-2 type transport system permease protein
VRLPSIFAKTLRDQRWQIIGFGFTLAAIAALDVYIWPAYEETFQNFELPPAIRAFLGDAEIGTPEGFLSAEFFSWIPVLLIVFAIIQGTGAVAGEESSGTLDLLLAQPVPRQSVVMQKAAATLVGLVLIVAMGYVGFLLSVPFADIEISLAGLLVAVLNMLPIAVLFYALALWAGTAAPNRAAAAAGLIALATAAYFLYSISNGVDALRDLRYATPFYYYGSGRSLSEGVTWWHVAVLLAIAAAFIALTLWTFQRRDISAGGAEVEVRAALRSLNPLAR